MIKIDKIFGDKKSNALIYILLTVGVMLLVSGNVLKAPYKEPSQPHKNAREAQMEKILSEISGVGEVSVMISWEEDSDTLFSKSEKASSKSVLIVAEGGSDSRVREKIVGAVSAALGAEPHKIEVFERKDRQ